MADKNKEITTAIYVCEECGDDTHNSGGLCDNCIDKKDEYGKLLAQNDEPKQCLYCDNLTSEPHFVSDCCGRGMCDDCYGNLRGTDEQIQLDFTDDEDFETIKPEYKNATYLCFNCANIWKIK